MVVTFSEVFSEKKGMLKNIILLAKCTETIALCRVGVPSPTVNCQSIRENGWGWNPNPTKEL